MEKQEQWGTGLYFLLGGDYSILPSREYRGSEFTEVSDTYFVNDMPWGPDSNSFGVNDTSIQSFIGRFPIRNAEEVLSLVQKIQNYEKASDAIDYSYINNNLISAAYMVSQDHSMRSLYDSTANLLKNYWYQFDFFNQSSPATYNGTQYRFDEITNIQTGENLTRENFLRALSHGANNLGHFHVVYHMDHSERFVMGSSSTVRKENITSTDIDTLDFDESFYSIIVSSGCHPADFRTSSIGRSFLIRQQRGALAFIGNVDVGRTTEYQQGSVLFNCLEANSISGTASHAGNLWLTLLLAGSPSKYRLHLLGDPTMQIWTAEPDNINISKTLSGGNIVLSRQPEDFGKNWNVCAYKEGELYQCRSFTNSTTSISIADVKTSGYVYLTYTGTNYRPVMDSIYINRSASNHVRAESIVVEDNLGNNDDILASGETLSVKATLRNISTLPVTAVTALLTSNNPNVTILDEDTYIPYLTANATVQKVFRVQLSPQCPDYNCHTGSSIPFDLQLSNDDFNFTEHFSIEVDAPKAVVSQFEVFERASSSSAYDYEMIFDVANVGRVPIANPNFVLSCTSPGVQITGNSFQLGTFSPGECAGSSSFFFTSTRPFSASNFNFIVSMTDGNGTVQTFPLTGYDALPSSPITSMFTLLAGDTYIDICLSNGASNDSYYIYRCTSSGSTYRLCESPITGSYYRDANLEPQTTYSYKISRITSQGVESMMSASKSATTECKKDEDFGKKRLPGSKSFVGGMVCWDTDRDGKKELFTNYRNWLEENTSVVSFDTKGKDVYVDVDNMLLEDCAVQQSNSQNSPTIGELFDDGEQYILTSTYSDDDNHVNYMSWYNANRLNDDGTPQLVGQMSGLEYVSPRAVVVDDLDADGFNEIIVPSRRQIMILRNNGQTLATISPNNSAHKYVATAKMIPNQSTKQILATYDGRLRLYGMDGTLLQTLFQDFSGNVTSPVVCDIDSDGYDEAFFGQWHGATDSLTIMKADYYDGVTPLFSVVAENTEQKDFPLSLGDLNGDNVPELVCCSRQFMMIYDPVSDECSRFSLPQSYSNGGISLIADVDGDNNPEIIYSRTISASSRDEICAMKADGTMAKGFPFVLDEHISECMLACDIDGDSKTELVLGEKCGQMTVRKTKGNANRIEWSMARGNAQNTGAYEHTPYPERIFSKNYSSPDNIECDLYVMGTGMNVSGSLLLCNQHKVIVWNNGVLNVNGGCIEDAKVIVKDGGSASISNSGKISLRVNKSFVVDKGGSLSISSGEIK